MATLRRSALLLIPALAGTMWMADLRLRGLTAPDNVVFDPETIAERSTFDDPHQFPVGIRHVVKRVRVVRAGAMTGEKPGRVLKGPVRLSRAKPSAAGSARARTRRDGG